MADQQPIGIPPALKPIRTGRPPAPAPPVQPTTAVAAAQQPVVFSPYVECWGNLDLRSYPARSVTLAFLLARNGRLSWDGTMSLNHWLPRAKASGKQIVLSFGGAAGTELATALLDPRAIATQYTAAANMYGASRLDFDVEGPALLDSKAVQRRNSALKLLQDSLPHLPLQYTLPVMPHGLDDACLALLRDAMSQGVRVHTVNIMAMNYGDSYRGAMGEYAIQAARATRKQLQSLGLEAGVGITPMLLENDVKTNVFTVKDARELAAFAASKQWVRFVGFWAASRDAQQEFATLFASSLRP